MTTRHLLIASALGISVLLTWLCTLALVVMKDSYQRLNFSAALVSVSAPLITMAICIEHTDAQARIKAVLITLALFFTNAILTHATARAHRIRAAGHLEINPDDPEDREIRRIP